MKGVVGDPNAVMHACMQGGPPDSVVSARSCCIMVYAAEHVCRHLYKVPGAFAAAWL